MMTSIILLTILSVVYKFFITRRNRLYDNGIKHSVKFDVPVICVGNISVGGTGKTPHAEYIIRLLKDSFRIAVLSRGYKRKTHGFVLADDQVTVQQIGDEPLQMFRKFPDITVAVQEKRKHGIRHLLKLFPTLEVILLDDAYQHRQVTPSLSIVMMDYNRPIYDDKMLPLGRLREPAEGIARADIVVVSKCPPQVSQREQDEIAKRLHLNDRQRIYFSTIEYEDLQAAFPEKAETKRISLDALKTHPRPILGFCGIASPTPFAKLLKELSPSTNLLKFSDHHLYSKKDVAKIEQAFDKIKSRNGLILTTEKDYYHLKNNPYFKELTSYIYYVTLKVSFLNNQSEVFNQQLIEHVRSYHSNYLVDNRKKHYFSRNRRYIRLRARKTRG